MKACGVVVEYNPFHNGHAHHIQEAKKVSKADVMIAVMSGNFLQRGEPAIIDKYHRTKAALSSGVDLVLELPYAFAVQNSDYFAKGAISTLHAIGTSSICFGSESGNTSHFLSGYQQTEENKNAYEKILKQGLNQGFSFPDASMKAYQSLGLADNDFDLSQPNNILGLSYVKAILDNQFPIEVHTIKRVNNDYHDPEITSSIASATSIRKEMLVQGRLTDKASSALPQTTIEQLLNYKNKTASWHDWELYFQLLNYRVQTMSYEELQDIHGVDEGLEYRLKKTAKTVENMQEWVQAVKTRRYTWTRIQRVFTHILTNTKKNEMKYFLNQTNVPYVRLLGMTTYGQDYLNNMRKDIKVPMLSGFQRNMHPLLELEEKAAASYYSVLPPHVRKELFRQEISGPVRV